MNLGEETQQSFPSELRRHIIRASQIAGQHWSVLGVDDDLFPHAIASDSVEVTAEYVTSLLLVRLLVLASEGPEFKDYSTASVCETLLGTFYLTSAVPQSINENVVRELRTFVRAMLHGYNDVPYHNFKVRKHSTTCTVDCSLSFICANDAPARISRSRFLEHSHGYDFEECSPSQ